VRVGVRVRVRLKIRVKSRVGVKVRFNSLALPYHSPVLDQIYCYTANECHHIGVKVKIKVRVQVRV
jgi:hypothetical protein